jgi:cell division protein FtsL
MKILQTLPKVKVPKKTLLITAGVLALLAVIIVSLALSERQSRVEAENTAAKIKATNTRIDGLQANADELRASNKALQATNKVKSDNLAAVCAYVTSLKTVRPTPAVIAACK